MKRDRLIWDFWKLFTAETSLDLESKKAFKIHMAETNANRLIMAFPIIVVLTAILGALDLKLLRSHDATEFHSGLWLVSGHLILLVVSTSARIYLKANHNGASRPNRERITNLALFLFFTAFVLIAIGRFHTSQTIAPYFVGVAIYCAFTLQSNLQSIFLYGCHLVLLIALLMFYEPNHQILFGYVINAFNFTVFLWIASRYLHSKEIQYLMSIRERDALLKHQERLIHELEQASQSVKTLQGMLPICSGCKKIRDDKGYWSQIESYFQKHANLGFSHGLCPDCLEEIYPEHTMRNQETNQE